MNERRRALEPPDALVRCECECHRVECFNNFNVSADNYRDSRVHAEHFLVAHRHQRPDEPVVIRTQSYLVIEKT
jgi:hypothetical protein